MFARNEDLRSMVVEYGISSTTPHADEAHALHVRFAVFYEGRDSELAKAYGTGSIRGPEPEMRCNRASGTCVWLMPDGFARKPDLQRKMRIPREVRRAFEVGGMPFDEGPHGTNLKADADRNGGIAK